MAGENPLGFGTIETIKNPDAMWNMPDGSYGANLNTGMTSYTPPSFGGQGVPSAPPQDLTQFMNGLQSQQTMQAAGPNSYQPPPQQMPPQASMNVPAGNPVGATGAMVQQPMNFGGVPMQANAQQAAPGQIPYRQVPQALNDNRFLDRGYRYLAPGKDIQGNPMRDDPVALQRAENDQTRAAYGFAPDGSLMQPAPQSGKQKILNTLMGLTAPGRAYQQKQALAAAQLQHERFQSFPQAVKAMSDGLNTAVSNRQGTMDSNAKSLNDFGITSNTHGQDIGTFLNGGLGHDTTAEDSKRTAVGKAEENRLKGIENNNTKQFNMGTITNTANANTETARNNKDVNSVARTNAATNQQTATNQKNQSAINEKDKVRQADRQSILDQENNDLNSQKFRQTQQDNSKKILIDKNGTPRLEYGGIPTSRSSPPPDYMGMARTFGQSFTQPPIHHAPAPNGGTVNVTGAMQAFHALPPEQQKAQYAAFKAATGLDPYR